MKIAELNADDRPRERLIKKGAESLSTAELLAILLRTGKTGTNVIEVARNLLAAAGGRLGILSRWSVEAMCRMDGVGPGKAATVAAALELGRRMEQERLYGMQPSVGSAEEAYRLLRDKFTSDSREECWCIFLKKSCQLICCERISQGGEDVTEVSIKYIVKRALESEASLVILSHNHPSGNPRPSRPDIQITSRLKEALDTFDITLADHIIACEESFYSFCDEKVCKFTKSGKKCKKV